MRWENLKGRKFWKLICTWKHFTKEITWWKQTRYRRYEECVCECWNVWYHTRECLLSWNIKSCWCAIKDAAKMIWKNNKTHWLNGTAFYRKYRAILARCNNKNIKAYKDYWLRWIKCEWKTFEEFKQDMYESYLEFSKKHTSRNTTIDRIDVNWNYCKENCRWATMKEQWRNRRTNEKLEYNWILYNSLVELCEKYNLNYDIVNRRLLRGKSIKDAVEQKRRNYPLHINNKLKCLVKS